jgi:hypothetical protein
MTTDITPKNVARLLEWLRVMDHGNMSIKVLDETADILEAIAAENAKLREALEALAHIHDGNPSDAMADTPPLEYARYMLWEVRKLARAALQEKKT